MDQDKSKRRTNIRNISEPTPVRWIVENATSEQLEYLNHLATSANFRILIRLIENFTRYNIDEVFGYKSSDDRDLALFRAAKRGEVAGLAAFIRACKAADEEIKRRRSIKR